MNIQIKFRGIDIDTGEMVFGGGIDTQRDTPAIIIHGERYFVDAKTVGQFTGLLDKNGVEIYEGDIVSGWKCDPDKFHVVVYDADKYSCGFMARSTTGQGSIHVWYENLEVIGNIHQNQELLK